MKIAKKSLSVFLSLLMVFSACSVALTGLSFTAAASTKVSAQDAYDAVIAAIGGGSGSGSLTSGNNAYTLTGDNGLYLEAAEKLWDYAYATAGGVARNAISGEKAYTYSSTDNNATVDSAWKIYHVNLTSTTVTAKTIEELSACGTLSTAAQNFIKNILGDRGTGLTAWTGGGLGNKSWNQNKSKNDDVTTSGKFNYTTTRSSVTKTTSVTTDINAYLCRFDRDTIKSAENVVRTSVSYTYDHFPAYYAYVSNVKSNTCGDPTLTVPTYSWQQLNLDTLVKGRTLGDNDDKTVPAFKKYIDLITPAMLETTYADMLTMKADAVKELYDNMTEYMFGSEAMTAQGLKGLTNESFYVAAVIDKYFNGATDYLNNLKKAYNVILAKNAMDVLNEYINMSYDDTNEAQMANIYGKVSSAWETYNSIPNMELAEEVIASYPIFNNYANRAAFEADCNAYIVELYKNLSTIKIRELKNNLADLISTYGDKVTDPYVSEYVVTNELISQINGLYSGYSKSMNEYATNDDQRVVDFYNEIFNEGNFLNGTVKPFAENLQLLTNERGAEAYADETLMKIAEYASSVSVLDLTNKEATDRYDELLAMEGTVNAAFASWKAKLANNEDLTNHAFRVLFENDYLFLVEMAKEITEEEIRGRDDAQLKLVAEYASSDVTDWNSAITLYNFAAVSNAVNSFDTGLYEYCAAKDGWVSDYYKGIYNSFDAIKAAVTNFKAHDGYISEMQTQHIYDENGLFKIRYAGNQLDGKTQLGYPNDIARDGADDNYEVTKDKVDQTIVKLDSFLTSNDFAELIGLTDTVYNTRVKNAEKNGLDVSTIKKINYNNLSEVIYDLLNNLLYTDDMFNKIIGMVYPTITNLLEGILLDLASLSTEVLDEGHQTGSVGYLDLGPMNISFEIKLLGIPTTAHLSGGFDIFLDGMKETDELPKLLNDLGLAIYPSTLAAVLKNSEYEGKYDKIANQLAAAGREWAVIVGDDGDLVPDFEWGIKSSDDFIEVISIILGSLGKLVPALLFGDTQKLQSSDSAVFVDGTLIVKYGVTLSPPVSAKAGLGASIKGLNLYENLWCKLLDAIGIHDYRTDIGANSSAKDIANALLDPIINKDTGLIAKIASAPLSTILDLIPNLLFIMSMDKISDVVSSISIPLTVDININWDTIDGGDLGADILVAIVKAAKGSVNEALAGILDTEFGVSTLLGDEGLSGILAKIGISDYTDINILISDVLKLVGFEDLKLPVIDTGAIISTAKYKTYNNKFGKQCFTLEADKADILYYLLTWVFGALGTEALQNFVFDLVGDGLSDTLKSLIGNLLTGLGKNNKDAVAALIELVIPKEGGYSTAAMEWVNVDAAATTDRKFDTASVVYLKYNTDWTREKADYMINNIDEIVESVLRMTGSDIQTISGLLQEAITGLFTNKNFSGVVKELVSLGYTLRNDYIYKLFKNDLGLEIRSWAASLSSLFPDVVAKYEEDEEAITDFSGVVSSVDPKLSGRVENLVIDEDGKYSYDIVWIYDGKEFEDGDISMFMDLFSAVAGPFAKIIAMFFNGSDFSIFDGALTFTGYDNYANSIGILFEILGINEPVFNKDGTVKTDDEGNVVYKVGGGYNHILSQTEYNTMSTQNPMDAFNYITTQLFKWVTEYLLEGNTLTKVIELVPRFTYFVESNGISTVLHNLLMPIFVVIDTIRPIIDLDFNSIVSTILADILESVNAGLGSEDGVKLSIDLESILAVVLGNDVDDMGSDRYTYAVDLNHFTFVSLLQIVDTFLGTELAMSPIVTLGINNICSQPKAIEGSVLGAAYGSSVDVTDAFTIFITSLIEAFTYTTTSGVTNGEIICAFIQQFLPADSEINVSEIYAAAVKVLAGVDVPHEAIKWSYMIDGDGDIIEPKSVVYLQYNTDWTAEVAGTVDSALDGLVDELLKSALGEGNTIATLINGILEDNVYSDEILATVVELIVNAIAALDGSLRSLVDVALSTDIAAWFDMCEEVKDDEGNVTYKLIDGYFDIDNAADKKTAFLAAIDEVLTPANPLLSWLFFGESIELFTSSKTDADGKYTYESIIKLNGGEGYAYGIVPILEALGCTTRDADGKLVTALKSADEYYDEATETYKVGTAVTDIFNALLARVDEISGKPAHEVFDLLPNILFFINADGVKASVNNLLAPVNAVIEQLSPVIPALGDDASIGGLLADTLGGLNISKLTTENILSFVCDKTGLVLSDALVEVIKTFYIGELEQFVSANNEYAYSMSYTEADKQSRKDMITIVLCVALEIFKTNKDLFEGVLPEGMYDAIIDIIGGAGEIKYVAPKWDYMSEEIFAELLAGSLSPENVSVVYNQYANDWNTTSASKLEANLAAILKFVLDSTNTDLSNIINSAIADNLYNDDILNTIVEAIVGLLYGLDESITPIVNAAGAVLGADLEKLYGYCTIEEVDGKTVVTCTEPWNVTDSASFAAALGKVLSPVDRILDWLFLGKDYQFFNDSNSEVIITISGGEGYAKALAPLLEALGCKLNAPAADAKSSEVVTDIVMALLARVDEIFGSDVETAAMINEVLDLVVNLIYFIDADGAKVVVNNLLAPVDALLKKATPIIDKDATEPMTIGSILLDKVGFDISALSWDMVFDILYDNLEITLTDSAKALIKNFYIGKIVPSATISGMDSYKMTLATADDRRDMLTIVLSVALETLELDANETAFADLFGEDTYNMIVDILRGPTESFVYAEPNWAYMYEGEDALAQLIANNLPARTGENSIVYTKYTNNWNKETADFLTSNLDQIVNAIIGALKEEGSTVGILLDAAITDGLYKDAILDKLLVSVVKLLAGLDYALVDSVGALLDIDVATWFSWCDIEKDADGKVVDVTVTKNWDIDSQPTNAAKKDAFVAAFTEALAPANRVIDWLFFGQDYTFLNAADSSDLITVAGGEGYAYAIVPILEALGSKQVKAAVDYYDVTTGKYNTSAAVSDVFAALCERLTSMCGDDTLATMLNMLLNVVYFINADGVKTSVNNLLQPAYFVIEKLSPVVNGATLDELIGFPLSDLTFETIFDIVADKVGLSFRRDSKDFVESFYMGTVEQFVSKNGNDAFRMIYLEDGVDGRSETSREMLTIVLSLVIENVKYSDNKDILSKWFTPDVYDAIIGVLEIEKAKDRVPYKWLYENLAGTGTTVSAIETTGKYKGTYNEYWTRDKAMYVANNLEAVIGNALCLLGLEIDDTKITNLETLLDAVISSNLYTQANADAILDTIKNLTNKLTTLEPYGAYISEILLSALDFDIHAWDDMTVSVVDGDRETFEQALSQIVAPAAPLFALILAGEDFRFFIDIEGKDQIVLYGSEGYAYGIIPVLEALDCDPDDIAKPADFKKHATAEGATTEAEKAAAREQAVKDILDPIFNRVATIEKDPINEVLNMLPGVIYFINSNGLDTAVKNIVNSVDTVLEGLAPVINDGTDAKNPVDLMTLLGVDLSTYDFEWIINMALDSVEESTGFKLKKIALDAVAELTVGKVEKYKSVNGETYCTMDYAAPLDKGDMVTIVLRILVDFVTIDENIGKIEEILAGSITDEKTYKSVCSLLEQLSAVAKSDPSMGQALYVLYYIFVGVNNGLEFSDDVYHDVNNSWQFILKMLTDSDEPVLSEFGEGIKHLLDKYLDDVFDDEGLAPNGFIRFFQKIAEFFKKIGDLFRKLFGKA